MACSNIGDPDADISGTGTLIALLVQASLSFVLSMWSVFLQIRRRDERKIDKINELLLAGSDKQSLLGIGLLISALFQAQSLSLYHFHAVYDTVSLVSVSHVAAISCANDQKLTYKFIRRTLMAIFLILYTAFVILFGLRLNQWDEATPAQCYDNPIATWSPVLTQPRSDQAYLGVASSYLFGAFVLANSRRISTMVEKGIDLNLPRQPPHATPFVVLVSMLAQLPMHLCVVIVLKVSNASHFVDGDSESTWGFGQVLAVLLLAETILECAKKFHEYRADNPEEQPEHPHALGRSTLDSIIGVLAK